MSKRKHKRVCTITFDENDNAVFKAVGFFGRAKSAILTKLEGATLTITPKSNTAEFRTAWGEPTQRFTLSQDMTITITGRVAPKPVKEKKKSAAERAWEKVRDKFEEYEQREAFLAGWKRGRA